MGGGRELGGVEKYQSLVGSGSLKRENLELSRKNSCWIEGEG